MSEIFKFANCEIVPLDSLVKSGDIELGRGNVISKIDIQEMPGTHPIYSSSAQNNGKMGEYSKYMFDEEMITWSVDGGGSFFYRPKHKFSVTNVSGYLRINTKILDYKYLHSILEFQHQRLKFDYQTKAHPSVIRELYTVPILPLDEQKKISETIYSVESVISASYAHLQKLEQLRHGAINELISNDRESSVKNIESVTEKIIDCEHKTAPSIEDSNFYVLGTGDIKNGRLNLNTVRRTDEASFLAWTRRGKPEIGDVVFTREAPAGEVCSVPSDLNICLGQRMVLLKPKKSIISGSYLALFLQTDYAKKQIYQFSIGTTVNRINIEEIKLINVAVPSLTSQEQIVEAINLIDDAIKNASQKLFSNENLKRALMQDLLTGKVRVN